ncbi:MAG TPA: YciI family protein [Pseudonocardiaceae bacterium]|jgi:hypothetical protein|nr:YciI family protein [Pseudonocardiaceae bacterium]
MTVAEYLILIYNDEKLYAAASEAELRQVTEGHNVFAEANKEALRGGNRLRPVDTATSIRQGADDVLVTDGPFVETKEALAGYYLIEATDLDNALAIAKQVPLGTGGIEVRPIWPYGE